eukprot:14338996-Alexandrium_andersonii.AAC.1
MAPCEARKGRAQKMPTEVRTAEQSQEDIGNFGSQNRCCTSALAIAKLAKQVAETLAKNPSLKRSYFEMWIASEEDWGRLTAYEAKRRAEKATKIERKRWLMECEIRKKYDSEAITNNLIKLCRTKPGRMRKNPMMPDLDEAVQCPTWFVLPTTLRRRRMNPSRFDVWQNEPLREP